MDKVIFYTQAYNASKTISRTIESILTQTHTNFIYYIYDNGSTDKTYDIAMEYAQKDKRIVVNRVMQNNFFLFAEIPLNICQEHDKGFFAILDADDEYAPDFCERILEFMRQYNLDIGACGSNFVDANSYQVLRKREVPHNLIIEGNKFSELLPIYHEFIRTTWGKMISLDVLRKCNFEDCKTLFIGADTVFSMETLKHAKRFGILSGCLHNYYFSTSSVSYNWDPWRLESDRRQDDLTRSFLDKKVGGVTPENDSVLLSVYFNAIMDTISILIHSPVSLGEKISGLHDIFTSKHTKKLLAWQRLNTEKSNLLTHVYNWIQHQKDNKQDNYMKIFKANEALVVELEATLTPLVTASTKKKPTGLVDVDAQYHDLVESIRTMSVEMLLESLQKNAKKLEETDKEYYNLLLKWYKDWYNVASFNINDAGFVNYFSYMYTYLKQNASNLVWLYENLENYRSKYQLKNILQHWLVLTPDIRERGVEKIFEHYFDLDIIKCDENEVFVDCGTYDGDTILSFIKNYGGKYKSIYGYELTPSIYKRALENLNGLDRIYLRNAGVADQNGTMTFFDGIDAGNRLMDGGNVVGNVVKIDDDIKEDITFIKMDIEGAEMAAIMGAQEHIKRTKPKLAISLYHKIADLIEIPKLLKKLVPEYKFYFQHCPEQFPFPTEYILIAVTDNAKVDMTMKTEPSKITVTSLSQTERKPTVIVGVNQYADILANQIPSDNVMFCTENETENIPYKNTIKVINMQKLSQLYRNDKIDRIIVAYSGFSYPYTNTFKLLKDMGINDKVFTVPPYFYEGNYNLNSSLVVADMGRAALDFLSPFITSGCNLKCKGCITSSPLSGFWFYDINQYYSDISKLSEYFWHISRFRISGGESLLHNDLVEMIKITRKAFPATEMAVQTNGLLLLKEDIGKFKKLFDVMRENHCSFQISAYKPIYEQRQKLEKVLNEHGIRHHYAGYSIPITSFSSKRMLKPLSNMFEEHRLCGINSVCHTLNDGYIYPCGFPLYSSIIEICFDVSFKDLAKDIDKMRINLNNTKMNGWEIAEMCNSPTPACRYCNHCMEQSFAWKILPKAEHKLADYIIQTDSL